VHLSTVYRTVDLLDQAGILAQVHVGHGPSSYHLAEDAHHHAVCDSCGAVIEVPPAALSAVVTRLDRDLGFAARPRHLTINGLCADCRPR
jgi:Fur family transcriptional regulator, ferric uptake regulator